MFVCSILFRSSLAAKVKQFTKSPNKKSKTCELDSCYFCTTFLLKMNIESIRNYCLSKAEVTEGFPFGNDTLVFKVNNKMFALMNLKGDLSINLKCDPEKAIELREHYDAVLPGYHMNKKQWNTVILDYRIDKTLIEQWIDDSYNLVVRKMSKKDRERIVQHKTIPAKKA